VSRAVILSGVRTPIGRKDGALSTFRPDDLAATVIAEAVARASVPPEQIEDVYFGAKTTATWRAWPFCSQVCRRRWRGSP
jgi:acetyl-CoA acetyltransferase